MVYISVDGLHLKFIEKSMVYISVDRLHLKSIKCYRFCPLNLQFPPEESVSAVISEDFHAHFGKLT